MKRLLAWGILFECVMGLLRGEFGQVCVLTCCLTGRQALSDWEGIELRGWPFAGLLPMYLGLFWDREELGWGEGRGGRRWYRGGGHAGCFEEGALQTEQSRLPLCFDGASECSEEDGEVRRRF